MPNESHLEAEAVPPRLWRWRPIAELSSAPNGTWILAGWEGEAAYKPQGPLYWVKTLGERVKIGGRWVASGLCSYASGLDHREPTHWCELPGQPDPFER